MKKTTFKSGSLSLGNELSKNEQKTILGGGGPGGGNVQIWCTGGGPYYANACYPAYCAGAAHGSFVRCVYP